MCYTGFTDQDLQIKELEVQPMLYGSQKRFDKNGDGKLKGAEWQRWYWRTFGDEIEAKERHRRNQAAEQARAEVAA